MKKPALLTLLAAALLASPARADEANKWRFEVTPYLLAPGIFGEIGIGPVNRPVDVTFDKIWNNLEFFQMWTVGVGYDRWALTTDVIYLGVGGTQGAADLDFNQWMVEPTLSYSVCRGFDLLAGARYNNMDASIAGPLGRDPSGTQAWWDPIVGANLSLPLGKNFSFNVQGDIGGFGVGSDLTWQAFPYFGWQFANGAHFRLVTAFLPSITKTTAAAAPSDTT